jgi:hypothetical protein
MTSILGPAHSLPRHELPPTIGEWWRHGITLRTKCQCGADREVPTSTLITELGAGMSISEADLPELAKRMKCLSCKERGKVTLRLVRE